jgi:hypothetical protein
MKNEKTLEELLAEPIVDLLMRRDRVEAHEVRAQIEMLRRRIAANHGHPLNQTIVRSDREPGHE